MAKQTNLLRRTQFTRPLFLIETMIRNRCQKIKRTSIGDLSVCSKIFCKNSSTREVEGENRKTFSLRDKWRSSLDTDKRILDRQCLLSTDFDLFVCSQTFKIWTTIDCNFWSKLRDFGQIRASPHRAPLLVSEDQPHRAQNDCCLWSKLATEEINL